MTRHIVVLGLTFAVLGTLFTISPEFLEHSPIGFETRGIVHHAWHYAILIGGFALALGAWLRDPPLEAFGLVCCGAATLLNLAAILTAGTESLSGPLNTDVSGFDIALRAVVIYATVDRLAEIAKGDR